MGPFAFGEGRSRRKVEPPVSAALLSNPYPPQPSGSHFGNRPPGLRGSAPPAGGRGWAARWPPEGFAMRRGTFSSTPTRPCQTRTCNASCTWRRWRWQGSPLERFALLLSGRLELDFAQVHLFTFSREDCKFGKWSATRHDAYVHPDMLCKHDSLLFAVFCSSQPQFRLGAKAFCGPASSRQSLPTISKSSNSCGPIARQVVWPHPPLI